MGKRVRSLGIHFNDQEIHITTHCAWRFRNRVMGIPTLLSDMTPYFIDQSAKLIRPMIGESTLVLRRNKSDQRIYLSHEHCVFVLTPHGTIVTVLRNSDGRTQFAESIKDVRRSKRTACMRNTRRSRDLRMERERRQSELRTQQHDYDHDHDD